MTTMDPRLAALVDTIVPGQETLADRVDLVCSDERPDWRPRLEALLADLPGFEDLTPAERLSVLDARAEEPELVWLCSLAQDLFHGEPGRPGGSTAARRLAGWPDIPLDPPPTPTLGPADLTDFGALDDHYRVVVIGSGAGGGVAARVLSEAGHRVLVVERGPWQETDDLRRDDLHTARASGGLPPTTGPAGDDEPRRLVDRLLPPSDPNYGNNAMTVGGGTRVYGAQAWRFCPEDFTMASRYGVPEGSALRDWPITFDDLEPHYSAIEWELGVSGGGHDPWAGPASRPLPMPPGPDTASSRLLARGAQALGWNTVAPPLLINSRPHGGRGACIQCPQCVGFACPTEAKAGSHNTTLPAALATGRTDLVVETVATRLLVDHGTVTGVELAHAGSNGMQTRRIRADVVVLAAGAVESARLLLLSAHADEPDGLGNRHDQVGRHLQAHAYAGALGIFDDPVVDFVGPGVSIGTCDFRHGNPGIVGGGMIANEFVPTPAATFGHLAAAGLVPRHGPASLSGMAELGRRMVRVVGPIQEVTTADARVRLDPTIVDRWGRTGVALTGSLHEEDRRAQAMMTGRAAEWLAASGARTVVRAPVPDLGRGPSRGQHQAGSCRMGSDPEHSVVDPEGRVWGHPEVVVADGSSLVTNGGVNPVLTILANARRVAQHLATSLG